MAEKFPNLEQNVSPKDINQYYKFKKVSELQKNLKEIKVHHIQTSENRKDEKNSESK